MAASWSPLLCQHNNKFNCIPSSTTYSFDSLNEKGGAESAINYLVVDFLGNCSHIADPLFGSGAILME